MQAYCISKKFYIAFDNRKGQGFYDIRYSFLKTNLELILVY